MDEYYGYDSYEAEIDLVDLIFHVFTRWRSILIAGLCGLVLLGGYKFKKAYDEKQTFDAAISAGDEVAALRNSQYKAAADAITEKIKANNDIRTKVVAKQVEISQAEALIFDSEAGIKVSENEIKAAEIQRKAAEDMLSTVRDYAENSVLLNAGPEGLPYAKATYQVKLPEGDDTLYRDPADALVAAYADPSVYEQTVSGLSEKLGIPGRAALELYEVSVNPDADTFTVIAYGKDSAMAKEVLGELLKAAEGRKKAFDANYRAHELIKAGTSEGFAGTDADLSELKVTVTDSIIEYTKTISESDASITSEESSIAKAGADIKNQKDKLEALGTDLEILNDSLTLGEAELAKLEEAKKTTGPTMAFCSKQGVKFGIIGFIAGVFVLALWYCAFYVLNGRLHTADEVKNLSRLPVLCVLNRKGRKKACFIDKFIEKLRGTRGTPSDEVLLQGAAAAAKGFIPGGGELVILSSKASKAVESTAEKLSGILGDIPVKAVSEISGSPENIDTLRSAGAILLLEERENAKIKGIIAELETCDMLEKKPAGVIVL